MCERRVIALGYFDGIHIGHGALLRCAKQRSLELGCPSAVLTLDTHPSTLLTGQPVPLINAPDDRAALIHRLYGIDQVLTAHFDRAMMQMPWQDYLSDYLMRQHGAVHIVCGHDHRFGYHGAGDAAHLASFCQAAGIGCDIIGQVCLDGAVVSSTRIRALLQQGQMEQANRLLGHPHCLSGPVISGQHLGSRLGFPTANLAVPDGVLAPAYGVYATRVILPGGSSHMAVTNVGVRPTVDGESLRIEPWLLDFSGNLYGQQIRVDFYHHLRGERKFDSLEALRAEIMRNADETRTYFASK